MTEHIPGAQLFLKLAQALPDRRWIQTLFRTKEQRDQMYTRMKEDGVAPFATLDTIREEEQLLPYRLLSLYPAEKVLQRPVAETTVGSWLVDRYHCEQVVFHTLTADGVVKNPNLVACHPPAGESRVFSFGTIKSSKDWWDIAIIFLNKGFGPYVCGGDQMVFVPRPTTRVKGQAKWDKLKTARIKGLTYRGLCSNEHFVLGQPIGMTIDTDR